MRSWLIPFCAFFVAGCNPDSRGFVLPEGNVERGAGAFRELECTQCHSVGDIAWSGEEGGIRVALGGATTARRTYGELLTSVINPSHRISQAYLGDAVAVDGESRMRPYNELMTVQQLVDIVTFLETEYTLISPNNPYMYRDW